MEIGWSGPKIHLAGVDHIFASLCTKWKIRTLSPYRLKALHSNVLSVLELEPLASNPSHSVLFSSGVSR
jgi:hypothetical protein